MKRKILVLNLLMQRCLKSGEFADVFSDFELIMPDVKQFLREKELLEYAGEVDGIIAGDDEFSKEVVEAYLPRLLVISKWGVGLDSIDLVAAKKLGIPVFNSPGAFSKAVAEVAVGYMLMLSRHLISIDQAVRAGEWPKPEGEGLCGQSLGIIGFGAIGQALGRYAEAFGMRVNAYDVNSQVMEVKPSGVFLSLQELYGTSDFICLCCNLTEENLHLIDTEVFKMLKKSPYIVNVARGPLIDQHALEYALESGLVRGAALDVFETEPLPQESALLQMPNVILGSHNANNLKSANEFVNQNTIRNLLSVLDEA